MADLAGFEGFGHLGAARRLSSDLRTATMPALTIRTVRPAAQRRPICDLGTGATRDQIALPRGGAFVRNVV
ncbi:hypothetical protein AB0H20_27420 [Nocardia fluminea]|uniref:hypothetical protein n=1 Tax=Nocardia fluminea TaxID=134984 RepID=UPI0033CA34FE